MISITEGQTTCTKSSKCWWELLHSRNKKYNSFPWDYNQQPGIKEMIESPTLMLPLSILKPLHSRLIVIVVNLMFNPLDFWFQQIWQPYGQAPRLLHPGTAPSRVWKVPFEWWREKKMWTNEQLNSYITETSSPPTAANYDWCPPPSLPLTCSHWTSTRTSTGDRWTTSFISWTSPSSPRTWLFISSQNRLLLTALYYLHVYMVKNIPVKYFLSLYSQEKDHVPEDRGSFPHVWGREEVGRLHVSRNHQERDPHVSRTNTHTHTVLSFAAWRFSDSHISFQGHDDDRLWLVRHHEALGGTEQGEKLKHSIKERLAECLLLLQSWLCVVVCVVVCLRLPCL